MPTELPVHVEKTLNSAKVLIQSWITAETPRLISHISLLGLNGRQSIACLGRALAELGIVAAGRALGLEPEESLKVADSAMKQLVKVSEEKANAKARTQAAGTQAETASPSTEASLGESKDRAP